MQRLSVPKQRSLYPLMVGTAALLALVAPAGWQRWTMPLAGTLEMLATPLSGPLTRLRTWIAPPAREPDPTLVGQLTAQVEDLRTRGLRLEAENLRLRTLLEQASVRIGDAGAGQGEVVFLPVPVIATSPDASAPVLTLRAGTRDGVDVGMVASVDFSQLLGRVTGARPRACSVLPITARASGELGAVIMTPAAPGGLRAQLSPVGDGTLRGDVEDKPDPVTQQPIEPRVGDEVRLADTTRWPGHAQMLLIGKVERVAPSPRQPLRRIVVVRPILGDPMRVGQAVLHVDARAVRDLGEEGPR